MVKRLAIKFQHVRAVIVKTVAYDFKLIINHDHLEDRGLKVFALSYFKFETSYL